MSGEQDVQAEFAAALKELFDQAGRPEYALIVRHGQLQSPPVGFKPQTLSDWFSGRSVPSNRRNFAVLVEYLQTRARRKMGRKPAPISVWEEWRSAARRHIRSREASSSPAPTTPDQSVSAASAQTVEQAMARATEPLPPWPVCTGAAAHGCRGRAVDPYGACLEHLNDEHRASYLESLFPGADVDHRGTLLADDAVTALMEAVRDPETDAARFGTTLWDGARCTGAAHFKDAVFSGEASFRGTVFENEADFQRASFLADACFDEATFADDANFTAAAFGSAGLFRGTVFSSSAYFDETLFAGVAYFGEASFAAMAAFRSVTFRQEALFFEATFHGDALFGTTAFDDQAAFSRVTFSAHVELEGSRFRDGVMFVGTLFESAAVVGPLSCAGTLDLSDARFGLPVVIEASASRVLCHRTNWASTSTLRLRHATVSLSDAVLEWPLMLTARSSPFTSSLGDPIPEDRACDPGVRLESVQGVDMAHLVLRNIDLSQCRFAGAIHLDQLRLEGTCLFAAAPTGLHFNGGRPSFYTQRNVLAEEHHWRSTAHGESGWVSGPSGTDPISADLLADLYGQLRHALDASRRSAEANDFAYGQREFLRRSLRQSRANRAGLAFYWALSGYGLRISRVVGWFGAVAATSLLVIMLWGLPQKQPQSQYQGIVTGDHITLTEPVLNVEPSTEPLLERISQERFELGVRVVTNAAVFQSSGLRLTTAGNYVELACRMAEPTLLVLAVLAFRNRVKP